MKDDLEGVGYRRDYCGRGNGNKAHQKCVLHEVLPTLVFEGPREEIARGLTH